jgi:hypothetical protein
VSAFCIWMEPLQRPTAQPDAMRLQFDSVIERLLSATSPYGCFWP